MARLTRTKKIGSKKTQQSSKPSIEKKTVRGKSGYPDDNPKTVMGLTKVSLSKVPAAANIYAALAMQDGARKYGPYNWRANRVTASVYIDACKRHLDAWFDGEQVASDSQVPHLGHAIACLAILVDALETGNLNDDRPLPGAAAALLARWTDKAVKTIKINKKDSRRSQRAG